VAGDLTIPGGRWWRGVILVGGRVDEHGGSRVSGAILSGLDRTLGGPVLAPDSTRGSPRIEYDSCDVARALSPFTGLSALDNTLVDNIP
jgi:hypothetical protein